MVKLKRMLAILLVIVLMAGLTPVFAQARFGLTVTPVATDANSSLGAGAWVYGIAIYASSANAIFGIYDYATIADAGNTTVKGETGQATAGLTTIVWFTKPIYFSTAVSCKVTNGVGFIYSGAEPE